MRFRLLLLLAACLLGGCNIMPEEDPGYHVRWGSTGTGEHKCTRAHLAEHGLAKPVVEWDGSF